jgi:two-component system sensor histidine kinase UhpB
VNIKLGSEEECYVVRIEDDGKGFTVSRTARGLGLIGIEERVAGMGGALEFKSAPGAGTRILVTIPLRIANKSEGGAAHEASTAGI